MKSYQDKNLIYVDGKGYKEKDLRDMIEYYQQNYKPEIILPLQWHDDVSSQILKHYSFYPHISKQHYRPELFYDQHCDLEITFQEFINYIVEEQPDQYQLLMINRYNDIGIQTQLASVIKQGDYYVYHGRKIDKIDYLESMKWLVLVKIYSVLLLMNINHTNYYGMMLIL